MSILEEILLEEYDRCKRQRAVYEADLKNYPKESARYRQLKQSIRRTKKDRRMLRRALGFKLFLRKMRRGKGGE